MFWRIQRHPPSCLRSTPEIVVSSYTCISAIHIQKRFKRIFTAFTASLVFFCLYVLSTRWCTGPGARTCPCSTSASACAVVGGERVHACIHRCPGCCCAHSWCNTALRHGSPVVRTVRRQHSRVCGRTRAGAPGAARRSGPAGPASGRAPPGRAPARAPGPAAAHITAR